MNTAVLPDYYGIPDRILDIDTYGCLGLLNDNNVKIITDISKYISLENPQEFIFFGFSGRPATNMHFNMLCRYLTPSKSPFKIPAGVQDPLLTEANKIQQYLQGINAIGMVLASPDPDKKVFLDEFIAAISGAESTPTYQLLEKIHACGYKGILKMRMGEDSARGFKDWRNLPVLLERLDGIQVMPRGQEFTKEEIISQVTASIFNKLEELNKNCAIDNLEELKAKVRAVGFFEIIEGIPKSDISSTLIRNRIKDNLNATHQEVLQKVLTVMLRTLGNTEAMKQYVKEGKWVAGENDQLFQFLSNDNNFALNNDTTIRDITPPYPENTFFLRTWKLQATILAIAELYKPE